MELKIDKEFKTLIPPLSEDEYAELEKSLLEEGCRDALVVWGDTLIDGHNRYEICQRNGIEFHTVERFFSSRDDAIEWIIRNQFGRRNLPMYERGRLALRLKTTIAAKAKENILATQKNDSASAYQKSEKQINTGEELARIAGMSHDTIHRVEVIERDAPTELKEAARKNEISVKAAYEVTKMEPEKQKEVVDKIKSGVAPKEAVIEVKKAKIIQSEPIQPPKVTAERPKEFIPGTQENMELNRQIREGIALMYDTERDTSYTLKNLLDSMKGTFEMYIRTVGSFYHDHKELYTQENRNEIESVYESLINEIKKIKEEIKYA